MRIILTLMFFFLFPPSFLLFDPRRCHYPYFLPLSSFGNLKKLPFFDLIPGDCSSPTNFLEHTQFLDLEQGEHPVPSQIRLGPPPQIVQRFPFPSLSPSPSKKLRLAPQAVDNSYSETFLLVLLGIFAQAREFLQKSEIKSGEIHCFPSSHMFGEFMPIVLFSECDRQSLNSDVTEWLRVRWKRVVTEISYLEIDSEKGISFSSSLTLTLTAELRNA